MVTSQSLSDVGLKAKDKIIEKRFGELKNSPYLCLTLINTAMAKQKYYRILSPDGIDIRHDKFKYKENEVEAEIKAFTKRYERQGYYSSVNGRIALEEIADCCEVVPC